MDINFMESKYENYQDFVSSFMMLRYGEFDSIPVIRSLTERFNVRSADLLGMDQEDDGVVFIKILFKVMLDKMQKKDDWRGDFDGDIFRRTVGLYSEYKFCKTVGKPFSMNGFDGGVDIEGGEMKFDIKTMIRNNTARKPHYANNLIWNQVIGVNYKCDAFIFLNVSKFDMKIEVLGYMDKESVVKGDVGTFRRRGSTFKNDRSEKKVEIDMVEISYKQLHKLNTLEEVLNLIK